VTRPRRIHVIARYANRAGGAEVYTTGLVRTLAARGHHVTLICHDAEPSLCPGVDIRTVPLPGYHAWPIAWRLRPLLLLPSSWRDLARLGLDRADAVITSPHQLTWAYTRCFPDVPLIYMPHATIAPQYVAASPSGIGLQRRLAVRVSHVLERWTINRAARTLHFSKAGCAEMARYYGAAIRPRFEIVPAPVDLPDRQASPGRGRPLRLLYVGRLAEAKNVHVLVVGLAKAPAFPSWHLDIVGDGEERERIERLIATHGLGDRVTLHGQRDDVARFYETADLFVFPSRMENFSLALLEAMSFGLPALTMRADGVRVQNAHHEFIEDGVNGFLVSGDDGFQERLARLIADPSSLPAVGRGARAYVERRHGWSIYATRIEQIIDELAAPVSVSALAGERHV
jgi:glycosyltransferase involved in cell wall biosynthesis